jgi:hypothetical protein
MQIYDAKFVYDSLVTSGEERRGRACRRTSKFRACAEDEERVQFEHEP